MPVGIVQAVFFARYTISNFRAVYGRLSTATASTYTKDFLQVLQGAGAVLEDVLPANKEADVEVTYAWPDGTCSGKFGWTGTRWHMKWLTNEKPRPWTVGSLSDHAITIPGDPTLTDPALADAEYARITASDIDPWLIAVKLLGEERKLHLRVYLRNPPPERSDRALSNLPQSVQAAIANLEGGDGAGALRLPANERLGPPPPPPRARALVAAIQDALSRDPNVLLIGPPGTGKSVAMEDVRAQYTTWCTPNSILFDPDIWGDAWSQSPQAESRSESIVFHPSYSYENFVAGLFPKASTEGIELEAKPGPMLCLSHWVGKSERRALLILDEFNRGAAAAIFGDTLSLLDKDKRSAPDKPGVHIQRPYSSHSMPVPQAYRNGADGAEEIQQEVSLPMGVAIVAAMNSTDRSVAPLDAALRRRFSVIRATPDYEALAEQLKIHLTDIVSRPQPTDGDPSKWSREDVAVLAARLLQALNTRIEFCLGEDFLLGHALIWNLKASGPQELLAELAIAVDTKVVPTLRMTFVDQDEALAAVLGIPDSVTTQSSQTPPNDKVAFWRLAPPALAPIAPRRLAINLLHRMPPTAQLAAIKALASG